MIPTYNEVTDTTIDEGWTDRGPRVAATWEGAGFDPAEIEAAPHRHRRAGKKPDPGITVTPRS